MTSTPTTPSSSEHSSIEQLLQMVRDRGWFLNNLIELDNRTWLASLRDGHLGYEIGRGDTPIQALQNALQPKSSSPLLKQNVTWRKEMETKTKPKLSDFF